MYPPKMALLCTFTKEYRGNYSNTLYLYSTQQRYLNFSTSATRRDYQNGFREEIYDM